MRKIGLILIAIILLSGCGGKEATEKIRQTKVGENYNQFVQEDGIFSFTYKNNYIVEKNNEVYFLRELKTDNIAFQIFKNTPNIKFESDIFTCLKKNGDEICYSHETPAEIANNLEVFPEIDKELKYKFLSRGEALKNILEKKYPEKDFSRHAGDCFYDISKSHRFSGEICFAKKEGIVSGISGFFYPESSINLWGILQLLLRVFEVEDFNFEEEVMNMEGFQMMTRHHGGYKTVAKGYYEGLFENTANDDLWPNRAVYKMEAEKITENFFDWMDGKQIRNYEETDAFALESEIFIYGTYSAFSFEKKTPENFEYNPEFHKKVKMKQNGRNVDLYYLDGKNIYKHFHTIPSTYQSDINKITLVFEDRTDEILEMNFLMEFNRNRPTERYEMVVKDNQFEHFRKAEKTMVDDPNVMPNEIPHVNLESPFVTNIKVFMDDADFKRMMEKRTLDDRYPAWVEIHYPDGEFQTQSAVIKTRGNAGKGYLKSSFTVEAFGRFEENENFKGDEFLAGSNEFKLRSHITEETLVREKLIYKGFEQLGYPSPKFFETTLEINNHRMGFYQLTEAVKNTFFSHRNIDVMDYYYPRNRNTEGKFANLTYLGDDETTYDFYRIKQESNPFRLLQLIRALERDDVHLIEEIDTKNIFDYAMFAYLTTANDSLAYNYYIYQDRKDYLWKMFFWDGDSAFYRVPEVSKLAFERYAKRSGEGEIYNNLIRYVFENLTKEQFDDYYDDFMRRWRENVDLTGQLDFYLENYKEYFDYDNALWNGRFLERKKHNFNTVEAIKEMRETVSELEAIIKR
jgi:hypothetical protein